ncbi:Ku protein [Streptomyces tirandamycinicus]|uniref:Non-homologous end joining protein Ku n=1 Tax=Streptomyces tirandamycinicus TaxID=2174846 RepID=A0A2S1T248_9ACTN|nr:Ku protein [Streptomyces tirandamycinicus]AWI32735.1 Ku protein [Streptomyces tirandamycinicus]
MPAPLASTAVTFGLVSIPVQIVAATEDHSVRFRQIHRSDGGQVRIQKRCEVCGQVLRLDEIGRGWEMPDGSVLPITDEDLDSIPLSSVHAIEIVAFVPAASIDPVRVGSAYFLVAREAISAKPYTLIRRALERNRKVAIARYVLRDRERLGMLRVRDDVLVLQRLLWPDEVRDPAAVAPRAQVAILEDEMAAAIELIDALTTDDLSGYRDRYRDALESLIDAKAEGGRLAPPERLPERAVDLMAALQASVREARERRGEVSGEPE